MQCIGLSNPQSKAIEYDIHKILTFKPFFLFSKGHPIHRETSDQMDLKGLSFDTKSRFFRPGKQWTMNQEIKKGPTSSQKNYP